MIVPTCIHHIDIEVCPTKYDQRRCRVYVDGHHLFTGLYASCLNAIASYCKGKEREVNEYINQKNRQYLKLFEV